MHLSEAKKKSMIEKWVENHKTPVICPGCNEVIREDEDLESVEYVKTKRKTEIFFHRECYRKVWRTDKTTKELRIMSDKTIQINADQSFRDVLATILEGMDNGETDTCAMEFNIGAYKLIIDMTVSVEKGEQTDAEIDT